MLDAVAGKQTVAVIEMSSQDITMPLTCAIVVIVPQSEHERRRESRES